MMETFSEDIKKFPVYVKSSYSSFTIPEIRKATCHADRVVLTGVVAECCVLSTAFALIDEGVKVLYLTDAVAGIDDETEMAAVKVLEGLCPTQVQLMTTKEYLETMGKDEN
jgi:nicotinamidase-related amidase